MPSKIIGRTRCPECGFEKAHVKESDKGTIYRYCPNKGEQYFARTDAQRADLLAKTTLIVDQVAPAAPTGSASAGSASAELEQPVSVAPVAAEPALPVIPVPVAPPAPAKRRGLF